MKERKKLIIDTDCGSDDAMAIAMALRDDRYEILCFTTVAGNVDADTAARNTLFTIEKAGTYAPPVYVGCRRPMLAPFVGAAETHGEDGMGDMGLRPSLLDIQPENGVLEIARRLRESEPGEIDIITLGTLSNIALGILLFPADMKRAGRIVMMGTAGLGGGNVTSCAEFNIWQDAEAAKIVFESGLKLMAVGWDACMGEAMLEKEDLDRLSASGELGRVMVECNRVLLEMNRERFGRDCLDMADPAAMAAALEPSCIRDCEDFHCIVDTSPGPSYGAVFIDRYHFSGKKLNPF